MHALAVSQSSIAAPVVQSGNWLGDTLLAVFPLDSPLPPGVSQNHFPDKLLTFEQIPMTESAAQGIQIKTVDEMTTVFRCLDDGHVAE